MKIILTLIALLFFTNLAYCQESENVLKFVGYNNQSPVFVLSSNQEVNEEIAMEEEEVAYDEEVMEVSTTSGLELLRLNELTNETETFYAPDGVREVLCYANGKLVGISDYGVEVYNNGRALDLRFLEDFSYNGDLKDRIAEFNENYGMAILSFSTDGKVLHYPIYSGLKIRSYSFETESYSEIDLSKIDEYGRFILKPQETKDYLFFLASIKGPYELFLMDKSNQELKKAPFYFGRRGAFGLKYHPLKDQVIFIYDNMTFSYHFGSDKYQQFTIPQNNGAKGEELASEFGKIFYSSNEKEWRYTVYENEELVSRSIGLNDGDDSFTLEWAEVQSVIEKEKLKNQSPSEELTGILKKLLQIPQPLSDPFKEEIHKAFVEFEQKYASRASEPEVQDAFISSKIAQLDTALVTEVVVNNSKNTLIDWVKNGKLNFDIRLGARIIRDFATNQPPVHPARIAVLEALILDHLAENLIKTYEEIERSGLSLLVLAYTANDSYDNAIYYNKTIMELLKKNELDSRYTATYNQLKKEIAQLKSKKNN